MLALVSFTYLIRKMALYAALPLGIALWLLVLALLTRRRRLIVAVILVLAVPATPFVSDQLLGLLEHQYPRIPIASTRPAEAVVVLGGEISGWDAHSGWIEWSEAVDRFEAGVRLVQAGKAPRLIFGGGELLSSPDGRTEGDALRAAALARGVAAEKIRVLRGVEVTADEAREAAKLSRQEGFHQIILVTSAFHMSRARHLFERAGFEIEPFPVDYLAPDRGSRTLLDFIPRSEALNHSEIALKEIYGLAYYRLFGANR